MGRIILVKIVMTVLSIIGSLKTSSTVKVIFEKTVPMLSISFEKNACQKRKHLLKLKKDFCLQGPFKKWGRLFIVVCLMQKYTK